MKVAVTGATGHIGGNLVRALLADGCDCRALIYERETNLRSLDGLSVERVTGNVMDRDSLRRAFEGAEVVFHLASVITLAEKDEGGFVHRINVEGTRNVVDTCLVSGVRRLVHVGSVYCLKPPHPGGTVVETLPLVGDEGVLYDRTKALGVREVLAGVGRGLDAVIVHPTGVIGPYDFEPSRMGKVFLDLVHRRMPSLIDGGYDWVDARDVARGAILAARKGRRGDSYLLGNRFGSMREVAGIIEQLTGVRAPRLSVPLWAVEPVVPLAGLVARLRGRTPVLTSVAMAALKNSRTVSHDKATRELGYDPRPLRESIQDTLEWHVLAGNMKATDRFQHLGRVNAT